MVITQSKKKKVILEQVIIVKVLRSRPTAAVHVITGRTYDEIAGKK